MANSFKFKRTKITSMKIAGYLDVEKMAVDTDDGEKSLSTLLSPFNGTPVEINIKVKSEEELDEPKTQE